MNPRIFRQHHRHIRNLVDVRKIKRNEDASRAQEGDFLGNLPLKPFH